MTKRTNEIKNFILNNVSSHPKNISPVAAEHFGTTRQATSMHIRALIRDGMLTFTGNTKAREYKLKNIMDEVFRIEVNPDLKEDVVWRNKILPFVENLKGNVLDICQYGFSEMLNNVIDHSESADAIITVTRTPIDVTFSIADNGIGIFNKIQNDFKLEDNRHALLELSKGNLTSAPKRHSGQGIFLTSRMFNEFSILSGSLYYSIAEDLDDSDGWIIEVDEEENIQQGTIIKMIINYNSPKIVQEIIDRHGDIDSLAITKTHVPIKLAKYKGEQLVSRSQAKRVLARINKFREVTLDFKGIESISPAFADEIFRVYQQDHLNIRIVYVQANPEIVKTIRRVRSGVS